jgi:hypothetical protein
VSYPPGTPAGLSGQPSSDLGSDVLVAHSRAGRRT